MVGIIDYGVGNLFSLRSSFRSIGEEAFVSGNAQELAKADRLVLPGVGAFEDAAKKLRASGLDAFVRQQAAAGKPLLGICLGMQMLLEESTEVRLCRGLGLIPGRVDRIETALKLPQIGWNSLTVTNPCALTSRMRGGEYVYFVHTYMAYADNPADIAAVTDYSACVTAMVHRGNVYGCQFHPEKSGEVGLDILRGFCELM